MSVERRIRIGVDVGGTFTDFVLVDDERDVIFTGKRLTTPGDPSEAIIAGAVRLLGESARSIGEVDSIVHGTTLVANAIIERKGCKVGLLATRGFRDTIEIGNEIRYDLYDLALERPQPIVPRHLRYEVTERRSSTGEVLLPLDPDELRALAQQLASDKVEAVAVSFLHAYRDGDHERRAREILEAELPGVPISLSSEIAPEIREYARTSTTCANAYVQPLMQLYLGRLENRLREMGLEGTLFLMLSAGGITTVRAASDAPIQLIESGPAAGAMAAAYHGALTGTPSMISFDMGGTTAKMCLIEDGSPSRAYELEAGRIRRFKKGSGLPLKLPVVDLIEIGAGGGSQAWIDQMGLLKVGPQSAGSEPGPVCYGRGGVRPTVTDADLLLGYLSPDYFLGGEMKLERDAVERAMDEHIARPLGMSVLDAAIGIHSVVNENMAAATRMYIAEKGKDPRRYAMMAFGGAGPVHAYALAKLLKLKRIICPFGAGVASALGFLVAPPAIDLVRSHVSHLAAVDWMTVEKMFAEMEREARALLVETGAEPARIATRRTSDMRYAGQGFEVNVALPDGAFGAGSADELKLRFLEVYRGLFDRAVEGVPLEVMSWRLAASAPAPSLSLHFGGHASAGTSARKGERRVWFPQAGFAPCAVYDRYGLAPGAALAGPAVVEERESTIVIGPDARASVDTYRNLVIDID